MKQKDSGSTTVILKPHRQLGSAVAPCDGYYQLREFQSADSTERLTPGMFELIERALGHHPEFGSEIEVTVQIRVIKRAKPSRKKCHNPWPAHRCPKKKRS